MIRLLHDYVLVERIELPQTTKGGIYLPLKAIELPQVGFIRFIGPKNPDKLVPGDLVMFKKFEGHRIEFINREFQLLHVEDLLLLIKE